MLMCMICVDLIKGRLTSREAKSNLNELVVGREITEELQEHIEEISELISHIQNTESLG